jgi:hypothetical protein
MRVTCHIVMVSWAAMDLCLHLEAAAAAEARRVSAVWLLCITCFLLRGIVSGLYSINALTAVELMPVYCS